MTMTRSQEIPKVTLLLLAAISVISLVLRYPTGNEVGVDSYSIHALADTIARQGKIGWLISPLSYLGLAPFSYAPAVPVSLAGLEELSGLGGEASVLIYCLFLGAMTPWTAFVLGHTAFRRSYMGVLVAFLISSANGMVAFTTWTVSTRGAFLTITPLAFAFFIDSVLRGSRHRRSTVPFLAVVVTLVFIHAMFLLLLPVLTAAYLLYRIVLVEDHLLRHRASALLRSRVILPTFAAVGVAFASFVALGPASETLTDIPVLTGGSLPDNLVLRIGIQWVSLFGLGVAFVPFGLYSFSRSSDRKRGFLMLALGLTFIPLALSPVYGLLVALPVALLLACFGIVKTRLPRREKTHDRLPRGALVPILVGLMIIMVPSLITIPRSSGVPCLEADQISGQTYNAGLYLRYSTPVDSSFAWDDHIEAQRLETIAGRPSLEPILSIGDLQYPFLARNMTVGFYSDVQLEKFPVSGHTLLNVREWLSLSGLQYPYYWGKHTFVLLQSTPDSPAAVQILRFYHTSVAVQRCGVGQTVFYQSLSSSNYVIYADELQRVYWIGGLS